MSRREFLRGAARGVALFFGGFTLLNLLGEGLHPGFDATLWWVNLRPLTGRAAVLMLLVSAVILSSFAVRGEIRSHRVRTVFCAVILFLGIATARDTVDYYRLLAAHSIESSFPVSFSLFVGASLALIVAGTRCGQPARQEDSGHTRSEHFVLLWTLVIWMIGFPLLQIHCFGWTDYRRQADAAVVFGCRVDRSGRLSAPLADRVRSACQLHEQGLVQYIIMSGGPGVGSVHETEAMRDLAIRLGVPGGRILIDRDGLSTGATVQNTVPLIQKHQFQRVLAVSHYYHLPRIKLSYQRAGVCVYTVPARQTAGLQRQTWQLTREIAALWAYYLKPLAAAICIPLRNSPNPACPQPLGLVTARSA